MSPKSSLVSLLFAAPLMFLLSVSSVLGQEKPETLYDKKLKAGFQISGKKMNTLIEKLRAHNERLWTRGGETVGGSKEKGALDFFAALNQGELLAIALEHPDSAVRAHAALKLRQLQATEFVPKLIDALEVAKRPVIGGTEQQIANLNLRLALIVALRDLTKLDFGVNLVDGQHLENSKIIRAIIERSRQWAREQKLETRPKVPTK